MKKSDNFLLDALELAMLYKKSLGAVEEYDLFRKKIKCVYVVFEDFDHTIKYYVYLQ